MKKFISRFVTESEGQDLIEYALLASVIAIAGIVGASALASTISAKWGSISSQITAPTP
jgi:Flp pilus assembly pilin Flp